MEQNEYTRRIQAEGTMAIASYLKAIFDELTEIKKVLQKKGIKTEEVAEVKKPE